jgi:histidinol-phosphate/aromatic aminotransferase/cobyric acid decarboxylase-like protein/choline kinase
MQAIILAAGMGKRLHELTNDNTKCMIEVNGVKLIDRMLSALSNYNFDRVIIVVGYKGKKLVDYIGHRYEGKLKIEFVNNPIYDKTNNIYSLALTKERMMEDDTILLESDLIFEPRMLDLLINHPEPNLALVAKYETWMDGTMVRIDQDYNIVNFVPKKAFLYEDVSHYYKTVNIYKFSKEFSRYKYVPFLDAYIRTLGENEYYEQVLRVITFLDHSDIKALPITNEKWYEIDDKADLNVAECIFSSGEDLWRNYSKRFGGYWRFPQMLDFNYLVNPFFPPKKMVDEMRANFNVLLTEYPSGLYVNSLLASKNFGVKQDYIVPGNGAAELIKILMEGDHGKLGVTYPTFEEYPNRKKKGELVIYHPNNKDFTYTADDLMAFFTENPINTLLIINPDNPSGNFIPKNDVLRLASWTKEKNIRLIIDESFVDFSDDYQNNTMLQNELLETYPNLFVMKSISKSFGVPGLRLGILCSSDVERIEEIKKEVAIWNINSFGEFYMQIYSKYEKDYAESCEKFIAERNRFKAKLDEIPFLRVIPSEANYFLCEVTNTYTAKELAVTLIKNNNILIKDCSYKKAFEGSQYVRIAIREQKDNDKLIDALKVIIR